MPYYPPPPPADDAAPWPREYTEITIPLSRFHGALLSVPKTMTPAEWARMKEFLALVEGVLVQS